MVPKFSFFFFFIQKVELGLLAFLNVQKSLEASVNPVKIKMTTHICIFCENNNNIITIISFIVIIKFCTYIFYIFKLFPPPSENLY